MDLVIHQEKLFPMKDEFQVIIILIAANSRARERGKKRREVKGECVRIGREKEGRGVLTYGAPQFIELYSAFEVEFDQL